MLKTSYSTPSFYQGEVSLPNQLIKSLFYPQNTRMSFQSHRTPSSTPTPTPSSLMGHRRDQCWSGRQQPIIRCAGFPSNTLPCVNTAHHWKLTATQQLSIAIRSHSSHCSTQSGGGETTSGGGKGRERESEREDFLFP